MEKQCSKCGEVKPLVEYGTLKGIPHNMSYCKVCNRHRIKNYTIRNSKKELERKTLWNKNNKEYHRDYKRQRYQTDPDFRFMELIRAELKGVKNKQEFKDIWDDVRKDYDEKGIEYHIDHKVPKNWFKVGSPKYIINHIDNLQVIDAHYNLSKKDRWSDPVPSDYLDKVRPYIKKKYLGLLKSL